ncbi:MAG TPA: Crp/Fnr family transcriptional regulator [Nitrospirota bacterium]|nr:Crp/Fnr family transcriptional regulator [Nitrospirota bacterium]
MNKRSSGFTKSAGRSGPPSGALVSSFANPEDGGFDQGVVQTYPAQAVIFHQDTQAHAVYLIEHGLVKLVRVIPNGHAIIVGLRRRHWLIGAPSVLLDQLYSFTAITLVSSSLRCIPAKDFLDLAKTNEQFSWYLHRLLARQIFKQMKNVEAMKCLSAKDRIKHILRDMIDDQNLAVPELSDFSLPLTNKELSQLLAITPEHLCRLLKQMRQEGLISRVKGVLTVTDADNLL